MTPYETASLWIQGAAAFATLAATGAALYLGLRGPKERLKLKLTTRHEDGYERLYIDITCTGRTMVYLDECRVQRRDGRTVGLPLRLSQPIRHGESIETNFVREAIRQEIDTEQIAELDGCRVIVTSKSGGEFSERIPSALLTDRKRPLFELD